MNQPLEYRRVRVRTWMGLPLLFLELWIAKGYADSGLDSWREFCGDLLTAPAGPCNGQFVMIRGVLLLTVGLIAWSCYRDLRRHPR